MENIGWLNHLYEMLIAKHENTDKIEWQDVAEYETANTGISTHRDTCRKGSRYLYLLLDAGWRIIPPNEEVAETDNRLRQGTVEFNGSDGSYIYNKLITVSGDPNNLSPTDIMKAHNIDPEFWEVISYKNNFWNSQKKGGELLTLYQSKVIVKPKSKSEITYEDIDKYFENKNWETKPPVAKFDYVDSGEYLEIDYADNHLGLLSWNGETGADYDIHIAEERFRATLQDTLNRCKGKTFKMINFVTLGDILHIDNMGNTTTKGTPQDTDGRITKIFSAGVDLMCNCIDMLLELQCPIRYTYTSGNHDTFSGFALAKSLQKVYEHNPNITFDISPNPQKIFVYGNTIVGYCHGDMNKKNLGEWLQKSYRKELGNCRFAEVHCGHLHSESIRESCGVMIKHLPTICESSLWEHKEGYNSQKGVMCYIYDEKFGLRDTWTNYI